MIVTGVDRNRITSINGLSPVVAMHHALGEESELLGHELPPVQGMVHVGIMTDPIPGLPDAGNDHGCVRAILSVDPHDEALVIAGNPEIGQTIRFHWRDDTDASTAWHVALDATKSRQPDLPFAGLLFTCSSRGYGFFEFPDHDAGMMSDILGNFPMAGMFANGELASPHSGLEAHTFCSVGVCFYPASTQLG